MQSRLNRKALSLSVKLFNGESAELLLFSFRRKPPSNDPTKTLPCQGERMTRQENVFSRQTAKFEFTALYIYIYIYNSSKQRYPFSKIQLTKSKTKNIG